MGNNWDESTETPPSAAVREHSFGRIDSRQPEEFEHAGVVGDERQRRLLSAIKDWYSPEKAADAVGKQPEEMPERAEDTRLYRAILRRDATETLSRAVHQGSDPTMSYFSGEPDRRADISGLSAISKLESEMLTSAPIVYVFGEPGSGKTNFALLLSEMWKKHHQEGEIGTNIRTWKEADKWIPRYPALDDWIGEQTTSIEGGGITQAEDAKPRLFVFDEASSHAAGHGEQGYETRTKLAPMLYKIRKANAGLIIIGHDGKDVHPAVRTLATVVERKRGEYKRATLYRDVVEREGRGKILGLDGIPETSYSYDDKEATSWSWGTEEEDDGIDREAVEALAEDMAEDEVRRLAATMAQDEQSDLSQKEIGRLLGEAYRGKPYAQAWVHKWKRRLEQGEI